jgi:hypothetical protein
MQHEVLFIACKSHSRAVLARDGGKAKKELCEKTRVTIFGPTESLKGHVLFYSGLGCTKSENQGSQS